MDYKGRSKHEGCAWTNCSYFFPQILKQFADQDDVCDGDISRAVKPGATARSDNTAVLRAAIIKHYTSLEITNAIYCLAICLFSQ
jgi:hypothetical protein